MQRLIYTKKVIFLQKKHEFFFVFILKFMLTLDKTLNAMAYMCKSLNSVGRAFLKLSMYFILYAQFSISGVLAK